MAGHQAVLLQESISGLAIKPNGIYVDGTFGRGGHSQAILDCLDNKGRLIAIDKDADAVAYAKNQFADDKRFCIVHSSYAQIINIAKQQNIYGEVDGILLDLGVSSPQLDNAIRGFSFMQDGPLDMRMDTSQSMDAETFVNTAKQDLMATVFKTYGEERFAKRIANAIVNAREENRIVTTKQLAEIVKAANPKWERHKHPATRVFQAIRIYINQELTDLSNFLTESLDVLAPGGRLAIITFHSLEDRIVKRFMRDQEKGLVLPIEIPIRHQELNTNFKRVYKMIKPNDDEIKNNVRARSAILRIGEKI